MKGNAFLTYVVHIRKIPADEHHNKNTQVVAMSNRSVFRRPDGTWANKRDDASRASSVHDIQADAISQARSGLGKQGGGELSIHGVDGKIREKDSVPPGNDPPNIPG